MNETAHRNDAAPGTLSRRGFHRSVLAGAAALTSGLGIAPATFVGPAAANAADDADQGPFVDDHTHLGWPLGDRAAITADQMLRWMDRRHVEQAVILPLISPEAWGYPVPTAYVLEQTKPHRDRLIPFCSIDPRTTFNSKSGGLKKTLQRYVEHGAKGYGEHKVGLPIDHPKNMRLYEACAELKLPVLFHLDNRRNTDQPGLPGLEKVLKSFPDIPFIGHAQGWWASISGDVKKSQMQGYPQTPVEPGGAIDRLMDKYPNIYGDLSAGSGANSISRDREFGRKFLIRRADRVLFGTDKLMPEQNIRQFELFASLDLPDDVRAKIYRENARRLFKLDG